MLSLAKIENAITRELNDLSPGIERLVFNDNMLVYRKNWTDYPFSDLVGFTILATDDTHGSWRASEGRFLSAISGCLMDEKSRNVETTLAYVYDPEKYETLMSTILHIERDEIHCRKFTLPIDENLGEQIMRLPIASLRNVQRQSSFPQSARKVLFQLGVNAECIEGILNQKSIKKIIDHLPDEVDKRKLMKPDADSTPEVNRPKKQVRFTELTIEGFRAYGSRKTFNLDYDLIVIAGPNGLGKTSFFDAIDFVVTGGISRFGTNRRPIPNLYHPDKLEVKLSARIINNDEIQNIVVSRKYPDLNNVLLDGTLAKRKEVIYSLTQTTLRENVDRLIHLFRASHLSNQNAAELTNNIRKDSLPFELVGRMLSLDDYVQGILRIETAFSMVNSDIEQLAKDISGFISVDEEITNELSVLKKQQITPRASEEHENGELFARARHAGIVFEANKLVNLPEVGRLKELRVALETKRSINLQQIDRLKQIQLDIVVINDMLQKLLSLDSQLMVQNESYAKKYEQMVVLRENQKRIELVRNDLEIKIKQTLRNISIHERFLEIKPKLIEVLYKIEQIGSQMDKIKLKQGLLNADYIKLDDEQSHYKQALEKLLAEQTNLSAQIFEQKVLFENIPAYLSAQEELRNLQSALLSLNQELNERQVAVLQEEKFYSTWLMEVKHLQTILDEKKQLMSKTKSIIYELRSVVSGNDCPLCGHHYSSSGALLLHIDKKYENLFSKEIREVTEALNVAKSVLTEKETILLKSKADFESKKNCQIDTQGRIEQKSVVVKAFEAEFLSAELSNFTQLAGDLQSKMQINEKNLENTKKLLDVVGKKCEVIAPSLNSLAQKLRQVEQEIKLHQSEYIDAQKSRDEYLAEIQSASMNPDISLEQVQVNRVELKDKLNSLLIIETKQHEALMICESQMKTLKSECDKLQNAINRLQESKRISQLEYDKKQINVTEETKKLKIDFTCVTDKLQEIEQLTTQINLLREEVITAEIMLDAKAKTAEMAKLSDKQAKNMITMKGKKDKLSLAKQDSAILSALLSILKEIQKGNLEKYFNAIGPIASLIQRRLRPVSGFGQVNIRPQGTDIPIRVLFEELNRPLPPSEYFSESQLGIIALSIFLCTTYTQNWSGLQTIMLDDPVFHFDDLNVYAFAEVLRSLLVSAGEDTFRPQIIVSTCDDRLLRILRNKFKLLVDQGRAKFYVLNSFTKNGPIFDTD